MFYFSTCCGLRKCRIILGHGLFMLVTSGNSVVIALSSDPSACSVPSSVTHTHTCQSSMAHPISVSGLHSGWFLQSSGSLLSVICNLLLNPSTILLISVSMFISFLVFLILVIFLMFGILPLFLILLVLHYNKRSFFVFWVWSFWHEMFL